MKKFVLIDGNSILNRAFYGIMGSNMLKTPDGKYTNAVYGFLAIWFKVVEEIKPTHNIVAFDLKAPTQRHKLYEGYKATRKGMPEELAEQMPIIKDILTAMNIPIIEKEGYEADDILGTLAKRAEKEGYEVTIVSGDRDTFQLASNKVTIRIPRTKMGKTEVDNFDRNKVLEIYGVEPQSLIEVKGLMGDTSDNIPGVPGIGEKTALQLIKEYHTIEELYEKLENNSSQIKGKLKQKLEENKDMAYLSKTLGKININVPLENEIEEFKVKEWNQDLVYKQFKELKFNRYIERFKMKEITENDKKDLKELFTFEKIEETNENKLKQLITEIKREKEIIYFSEKKSQMQNNIIQKQWDSCFIYQKEKNKVTMVKIGEQKNFFSIFKEILEDEEIQKYTHNAIEDYIILRENGIHLKNLVYDLAIATYILNPTENSHNVFSLAEQYLKIDYTEYWKQELEKRDKQITLFEKENSKEEEEKKNACEVYIIAQLIKITEEELKKIESFSLFSEIEMPLVEVLGEMQYNGMYLDKQELIDFGLELKNRINELKQDIYELSGEEFNLNSTQQLGKILFEKLNLPVYKKTKTGYSTDVDSLEKLKKEHPIIEKILEYRSVVKLNSTYVEGLIPYINEKTKRIHSHFHQTITATGRISSTEPNLQNIPTRMDLGRKIRKAFKPEAGYIYIDADYSQIELRVLAHIARDKHMIEAFEKEEDIHKQVASKVFNIQIEDVTKEQRSAAKAVNFGIVYGISDYGLAEQLGISNKKAKQYIEQYLEKYNGVKNFMEDIVEQAKQKGYVETLFHRRRYVPEIKSSNYKVRQFGNRIAMNTPIQGTAADIIKIAMIKVKKELEKQQVDAKLILQVHDELMIETRKEEKEKVKTILQNCMENAITLSVPLKVEVSEAENWQDVK